MQKLLVAALLALALPPLARAGDVAMRVQDVPLGPRTLAATTPAMHFNMLAVHWRGSGTVLARTRRLHGGWRPWVAADADAAPDGGTGTWRDGNLDWVGASDRVQYRIRGTVTRLRAYELWSRVTGAATTAPPRRNLAEAGEPAIVTRAGWHANEEIVRAKPLYAPTLRLAIVHHTAGTNDYTPAQAAAIVRGIEVYHVQGNGWNDIGYNFLVDRFGNVYEGRRGGMTRNVIGAHAEGFNTGSVGVALIGNYQHATPPKAQQAALVKLLAWRLDVAHVDPLSTVTLASRGNAKFRAGKVVTLRAISGHRDTGPSECPGNVAYALIPALARQVAATGLPKLYGPTVAGALGGPIRFRARLSSALPWTVSIVNAEGKTVASGSGKSSLVDWTWSAPAGKAGYRWTISAAGARAATGTLGKAPPIHSGGGTPPVPPAVSSLTVAPALAAPVTGVPATVTVRFVLSATAPTTVQLVGPSGRVTLEDGTLPAGASTVQLDAGSLVDGAYQVVVAPRGAPSATAALTVDRTLTALTASSQGVSPNADGVDDSVSFAFTLAQPTPVQLTITQNGAAVATPYAGVPPAGPTSIAWDGTAGSGVHLPDGAYVAVLTYSDALGTLSQSLPLTVDTIPPIVTVVDPQTMTFSLSEPANVTFVVNGGAPIVQAEPQGTFTLPFAGTVASFTAQAADAAGNVSATVAGA